MKINLATKFTIFRIILIPVILLVLLVPLKDNEIVSGTYWPNIIGLIIFVIAAITDAIDGQIARRGNMVTNLGKFLDPVADKLLVNSVLIYLAYVDTIPLILVIIMIMRDIIVDALRMIAVENNVVIAANIFGKLKTIFQMVLIPLLLLFTIPFVQPNIFLLILAYLTTLISVISGIIYLVQNINVLKK